MVVGLLSRDVGDEDVETEELREKNKVISNGELRVELAGIGVDLVVDTGFVDEEDVGFMPALFLTTMFVEIDDAVELGIVEEGIGEVDTGMKIFSDVEEYFF